MFKKIAATALLAITSSAAFAAEPNSIYAGLELGRTEISGLPGHGGSAGAFIGYHLTPNVAIEAGYRYLARIDVTGYMEGSIDVHQTSLSAVGTLPLGSGFSVLGRLGYSRVTAESDDFTVGGIDDTRALIGFGIGYAFTPALSARLEFQKPSGNTRNISLGLAYTF